MDGQDRVESCAGAHIADDVFIGSAHTAHLFAVVLQVAAAFAPAGRMGLQKIAPAQAAIYFADEQIDIEAADEIRAFARLRKVR